MLATANVLLAAHLAPSLIVFKRHRFAFKAKNYVTIIHTSLAIEFLVIINKLLINNNLSIHIY